MDRLGITLSRIVPKIYRENLKNHIKYSGDHKANGDVLTGFATFVSIILAIITFVIYRFAVFADREIVVDGILQIVKHPLEERRWVILIAGFFAIMLVYFLLSFYYFLISTRRKRFVEKVLPDMLFLIASNLKSGATPFHAVKSSVRADFGPLAEAFELSINKSLGTKAFHESIAEVPNEINSEMLRRSMKLLSTAIKSGSRISTLLENIAQDIIDRQTLKKEMVTNTKTNAMFILFMVILGAPFLMSVSIFFVDAVEVIQSDAGLQGPQSIAGVGTFGGSSSVSSNFLLVYAYIFLFFTGLMASYFSATMVEGDGRNGLKKAPLVIIASYVVFWLSRVLVTNLLGGLF